ncbi:MAG: peptidase [Geminicoccaceae bacterium]
MRRCSLAAAILLALAGGTAHGEDSHERALEALERGEIAPLDAVLDEIRRQRLGGVLEIELERRGERWVYEIEALGTDGVIREILLDARQPQLRLPDEPNDHDDEQDKER